MFPGGETETYGATRTKARHVTEMSATYASAALFPHPNTSNLSSLRLLPHFTGTTWEFP